MACRNACSYCGSAVVQEGLRLRVDVAGGTNKGHTGSTTSNVANMYVYVYVCMSVCMYVCMYA